MIRNAKYTTEQLVTAYKLCQDQAGYKIAGQKTGINPGSVHMLMKTLEAYLTGAKPIPRDPESAYVRAVAILKNEPQSKADKANGVGPMIQPSDDNFEKLEKAFLEFQDAIADVIVSEVEKRTKEKVLEKENEITTLKEKYEQELQRLQAIIVDAKNSSITGLIKRKWGVL